ncbi:MAG: hypothetical protein AABO41_26305 [Acidobacteriota bacterium]
MSDLEHPISHDDVRDEDRDTQREVMETWFRRNFEDPAEGTPYESREGGYIWIGGGPYDAHEQLEAEFSGIVPDDVIEELVRELEEECLVWAPNYDQLVDDIGRITEYYSNFCGAIHDITELLNTTVPDSAAPCFLRLLFVNVITALETYLSDAFTNTVMSDAGVLRRFLETTPEFKAEKISLADVFKAAEEAEAKAKAYLGNVVWHNIGRVMPMYRATLDIEFRGDTSVVFRAILTRHDIVHRNGKRRDGSEILIKPSDVSCLISSVEFLVQGIDDQLSRVRSKR